MIGENVKVAILMATYNGGKYIREQLNSILNQTYRNLTLIIRDDGSTDMTLNIIKQYLEKDERVQLIRNETNTHGAYLNFWNLMYYAKESLNCSYYFFSDQDDVWKLDKIEKIVSFFTKKNSCIPRLLYSNMEIINANGKIICKSYDSIAGIGNQIPQATFFTRDIFWGCTMAVNKQLMKEMPLVALNDERISIMSHDTYIAEFAALFGKIHYFDDLLIQHRKHDSNASSDSAEQYGYKTILAKVFCSSYGNKAKKHARTYAQSLIAIEYFKNNGYITNELLEIEYAIHKAGIVGIQQLRKYKVKKQQVSRNIILYLVMLFRSYKRYLKIWTNSCN